MRRCGHLFLNYTFKNVLCNTRVCVCSYCFLECVILVSFDSGPGPPMSHVWRYSHVGPRPPDSFHSVRSSPWCPTPQSQWRRRVWSALFVYIGVCINICIYIYRLTNDRCERHSGKKCKMSDMKGNTYF